MPCNIHERKSISKSIQFVSAKQKQVDRILWVPKKNAVLR